MKKFYIVELNKSYNDDTDEILDIPRTVYVEKNSKDLFHEHDIKSYFKKYDLQIIKEISKEDYELLREQYDRGFYELSRFEIDLTEVREIKMPKYRIDYLDKLVETRRPYANAISDTIYKSEISDGAIEELFAETIITLEELIAKYQSDLWEYRQRFGDLN